MVIRVLLLLLFLCSNVSALPTTWQIQGTFGDTLLAGQGTDPSDYPFPELYGGHFNGTFSYDLDYLTSNDYLLHLPATTYGLPMESVLINIFSNTNDLARTITVGENNIFSYSSEGNGLRMRFGTSAGILNDIYDLEIHFTGNVASGTTFSSGFLETDKTNWSSTALPTGWGLNIVSGELTHISGPIRDIPPAPYEPVPEPATMLLLGSGLIALAVVGRKKFKK